MNIKQFSNNHLRGVLRALLRVKNGEIDNRTNGICWNAQALCGYDTYCVIEQGSKYWSNFSGDKNYPVPSTNREVSSQDMYEDIDGDMWTGEYGTLRYELLDFLIDELTTAVDIYDNKGY